MKGGILSHFFKTANNSDYVGPLPETKFYGADFMSGGERAQFSAWYEGVKDKSFDNREELLAYCLDDANLLRQACCAFRISFEIGQGGPLVDKLLQYRPFPTRCSRPCF